MGVVGRFGEPQQTPCYIPDARSRPMVHFQLARPGQEDEDNLFSQSQWQLASHSPDVLDYSLMVLQERPYIC